MTAAVWLLSHVAMLAATPILISQMSVEDSTASCSCPHTGEAACPMHHRPTSSGRVCLLRAVQTNGTAAMHALFDVIGFEGLSTQLPGPIERVRRFPPNRAIALARPSSPDAPPPRG